MILTVVEIDQGADQVRPWRSFFRTLEEVKQAICDDLSEEHKAYRELCPEHVACVSEDDEDGVFATMRVDERMYLVTQVHANDAATLEAACA